jgi:hypothetical protein
MDKIGANQINDNIHEHCARNRVQSSKYQWINWEYIGWNEPLGSRS